MTTKMKTAVATQPSMCRHCNRSATKFLVWVYSVRGTLAEGEFCDDHFADMTMSMSPIYWDWERV